MGDGVRRQTETLAGGLLEQGREEGEGERKVTRGQNSAVVDWEE